MAKIFKKSKQQGGGIFTPKYDNATTIYTCTINSNVYTLSLITKDKDYLKCEINDQFIGKEFTQTLGFDKMNSAILKNILDNIKVMYDANTNIHTITLGSVDIPNIKVIKSKEQVDAERQTQIDAETKAQVDAEKKAQADYEAYNAQMIENTNRKAKKNLDDEEKYKNETTALKKTVRNLVTAGNLELEHVYQIYDQLNDRSYRSIVFETKQKTINIFEKYPSGNKGDLIGTSIVKDANNFTLRDLAENFQAAVEKKSDTAGTRWGMGSGGSGKHITVVELKKLASKAKIVGRSLLNKNELISALRYNKIKS